MGRTFVFGWILVLCLSISSAHGQYHSPSQPFDPRAMKVTNLHFFFHETLAGENFTVTPLARANITRDGGDASASPGTLYVIDDPLRTGSEENSEMIGNAQGLVVSSLFKNGVDIVVYYEFGFNTGEFNGSSFSVFSRMTTTETQRELAIVGGRVKFRMATGFLLMNAIVLNQTNIVMECNATLIHY